MFYGTGPVHHCIDPLGMQDGTIADNQIHGHAALMESYSTDSARLWHADGVTYGFIPSSHTSTDQYIEVDLQRVVWVSGIIMQGIDSPDYQCWTERYKVKYSLDKLSWHEVYDERHVEEVSLTP